MKTGWMPIEGAPSGLFFPETGRNIVLAGLENGLGYVIIYCTTRETVLHGTALWHDKEQLGN